MAASSTLFSPPPLSWILFNRKPIHLCATRSSFSPLLAPVLTLPSSTFRPNNRKFWKLAAIDGNLEAIPVESTSPEQVIVSTSDDGVSAIISALLFAAFIGLSILTIGVIYIAVTDFFVKRERDKFEKEEAAKKKRSGKKGKPRARAGPRGFGQKNEEDDDDDYGVE